MDLIGSARPLNTRRHVGMFRVGKSIKQAKPARQRLKLRPTKVSSLKAPTIGQAKLQAWAGMPPPLVKLLLVHLLAINLSDSFRQSRLFLFTVTSRVLHCFGDFVSFFLCPASPFFQFTHLFGLVLPVTIHFPPTRSQTHNFKKQTWPRSFLCHTT